MSLLDHIATHTAIAVVGVAKNCGKTTTLNCLLRHRRSLDLEPPGLVSIGVDGESKDIMLGTEKPPILVERDQWVVTAEQALQRSTARFEYVRDLRFSTPLGSVMACRVVEPGAVILAGLRHRREVAEAVDALRELGAAAVWVDGAYGRIAGAHRSVADAVVLSTGAVVGGDAREVANHTEDLMSRLALPRIDDGQLQAVMQRAVDEECVVLLDGERGVVALPVASAVTGLDALIDAWSPTVEAVAIPGLISDRVVEELLAIGSGQILLVPDGTVLHTSRRLWRRLRKNWDVRALDPVNLLGLSYNPTCVTGRRIDGPSLEGAIRALRPDLAIFNPLL